jgi:limonene-1,2-epoxide hydrolase
MEVKSISECGDHVIAKWKLTATQNHDCEGYGSRRVRISLEGVSIAYIEDERIVKWSDFYDATKSWRFGLAELYKEWIEY